MEEFTTMPQVSTALNQILQNQANRDEVDSERRKVDDERDRDAKARDKEILARADDHGGRLKTLEVNWMTFFGENGAFTFVKNQLKDQGAQSKWLLGLVFTALIGIIATLVTKH